MSMSVLSITKPRCRACGKALKPEEKVAVCMLTNVHVMSERLINEYEASSGDMWTDFDYSDDPVVCMDCIRKLLPGAAAS
jgi:hypothetical protein